jgi:hypothetical protein
METARFLLWAILMALASAAFQIALATGHFKSYEWALPWLWASAGGLFLAWLILTLSNKKRTQEAEGRSMSQHNEQRAEANPHQTVIIGNDVLRDRTPPLPPPQPKPRPELELIGCKATMIAYGSFYEEINPLRLGPDQWEPNAFVAIFRNKPAAPGKHTPSADYATAHLIYRNEKGEKQIIDYGTWLGKYEHSADFKASTSRTLVLSSMVRVGHPSDGKIYVFDNPNKFDIFSVPYAASGKTIYAPEPKLLLPECSEVEVTIVSDNATLYQGMFRRTDEMTWSPA